MVLSITAARRTSGRLALAAALASLAACGGDGPTEPEEAVPCSESAARTTIAAGQTINAVLSASDCLLADDSHADLYRFTLTSARAVQIDMTSDEVDAYLGILDADGDLLVDDDDGGGGTDARIATTLAAGSYVIVATSFDPGDTGRYQLRVQ